MKAYDKNKALLSIHVPKAGGTSLQPLLKKWFGPRLYFHYFDEKNNHMPPKRHLLPGICIHGHFNKQRHFGIDDYYPEAHQLIAFLRDPFEMVVSRYFDVKARGKKGQAFRDGQKLELPENVNTYLEEEIRKTHYHPNILDYMPGEMTLDNYHRVIKERFIYIGIMEDFQVSVNQLARKLGFEPLPVRHLNPAQRYQEVSPRLRQMFVDHHPLEYAVFNYARENYNPAAPGKKKGKPIFIHSLFRTGSTYTWNKFRQDSRYCCYYEPFHQSLSEISTQKPSPWAYNPGTTDGLRHPGIEKNHFFEYQKLLKPGQEGVPHFKKSFSFDDFCRSKDHPDQKKYIDFLMTNAGEKTPLLQFNRSSFRIRWFKRHYPGAVHIYLVRNPRDQFQSYVSMAEENELDIFLTMDLLTAGINRDSGDFRALAARVPLLEYHADRFEDEQLIYSRLLPLYSTAEKYYIFYFTWFRAFMENVLKADLLLNIDLLSTSPPYRREIQEKFKTLGIETIDFSDARIGNYETYGLSKRKMTQIEKTVQALILETYNNKEIERAVNNLDEKNRRFFKFDKTTLYHLPKKTNPKININKELLKKYKLHFSHFSGEVVRQHHLFQELKEKLNQKGQLLAQKNRQLEEKDIYLKEKDAYVMEKDARIEEREAYIKKILNSKSYCLGQLILSPFTWLKQKITKERIKSNE